MTVAVREREGERKEREGEREGRVVGGGGRSNAQKRLFQLASWRSVGGSVTGVQEIRKVS